MLSSSAATTTTTTGGDETNLRSNRVVSLSSSSKSSSSSSSPSPFSPSPAVLPTPRGKTMEEVWKDINLASLHDHPSRPEDLSDLSRPQNPHANFRGMIFQDFLAKDPPSTVASLEQSSVTDAPLYASLPPPPVTVLSLNSGPDFHFLETSHPARPPPHSHLVHHSPVASFAAPFDGLPSSGKKRFSESDNNSCDRRHKRMIKNRESAARSRARKQEHIILSPIPFSFCVFVLFCLFVILGPPLLQAYTNELEQEVQHLAEENARLKRQQEELTSATAALFPKKNALHRTSTAPF